MTALKLTKGQTDNQETKQALKNENGHFKI